MDSVMGWGVSTQPFGSWKTFGKYDGIWKSFSVICCRESKYSDGSLSKARSATRSGVRGYSEGKRSAYRPVRLRCAVFFLRA